jgi:hypothetical protein
MSQAIVDPSELKRFAHHLRQFNAEMRDRLAALHGHLLGLSDTWRDHEHVRFVEQFEETLHVLEIFLKAADQHIPFLLRKAERVEDYLHQK